MALTNAVLTSLPVLRLPSLYLTRLTVPPVAILSLPGGVGVLMSLSSLESTRRIQHICLCTTSFFFPPVSRAGDGHWRKPMPVIVYAIALLTAFMPGTSCSKETASSIQSLQALGWRNSISSITGQLSIRSSSTSSGIVKTTSAVISTRVSLML